MTVKDKVGRHRWIGFLFESQRRLYREELARALNEASRLAAAGPIQLIIFDGRKGIVKVPHINQQKAISVLSALRNAGGVPVGIRTVVTSGVICKVKERLNIPNSRPEDRHGGPKRAKQAHGPRRH